MTASPVIGIQDHGHDLRPRLSKTPVCSLGVDVGLRRGGALVAGMPFNQ